MYQFNQCTQFRDMKTNIKYHKIVNTIIELRQLFEMSMDPNSSLYSYLNQENNWREKRVIERFSYDMCPYVKECDLLLMSQLPQNKIPERGKMYLESWHGLLRYVVINLKGQNIEGSLNIRVGKLYQGYLDHLKGEILKETSSRGDTLDAGALNVYLHAFNEMIPTDGNSMLAYLYQNAGLALFFQERLPSLQPIYQGYLMSDFAMQEITERISKLSIQ